MKARRTVGFKPVHLSGQFPKKLYCHVNFQLINTFLLLMHQEIAYAAI